MNRIIRRSFSSLISTQDKTSKKKTRAKAIPSPLHEILAGGPNRVEIKYPAPGEILPVQTATPVWIRYVDVNGQPKPNQQIELSIAGYGSVYPFTATTDADGWATIPQVPQVTLSKPGTLGTVASFDATLTAMAQSNSADRAQATFTASTTVGGPVLMTLDPKVNSLVPDSTVVYNGTWTLISGTCVEPDGTPATGHYITWDVATNPPGLQPTLAAASTYTDENGRFCNFVLNVGLTPVGTLTVNLKSANATATKNYPCAAVSGTTILGTVSIDVLSINTGFLGGVAQFQAIYTRKDNGPPGDKTITWSSAPDDVHFQNQSPPSTTDSSGRSTIVARPDVHNDPYTEAVWADVIDGDNRLMRGVLVRPVENPGNINQDSELWELDLESIDPTGSVFVPGVPHEMRATLTENSLLLGKGKPLPNVPIDWLAEPADRFVFSQPYPTMTDVNGHATIQVTALGTEPLNPVKIRAHVTEHSSNYYDGIEEYAYFYGSIGSSEHYPIIIVPGDGYSPKLYAQHPLTATYLVADNKQKTIEWVVVPDTSMDTHHFYFSPNPSKTNNNGQATTLLTGYGPNVAVNVVVYARAYNNETGNYDLSRPLPLSFVKGANPLSNGHIDLVSVEGSPLSEGNWQLIQATYTQLNGTPFEGVQVNWKVDSANVQLLTTDPTTTDEYGVTTNAVKAINTNQPFNATISASAQNPNTKKLEETDLPLTFQAVVNQSGQMELLSPEPPLAFNKPYPFTVTYKDDKGQNVPDDTPIYWAAYPADRIFFDENPTYTKNGRSTNQVLAIGKDAINDAMIWAWSPVLQTGINDYADVTTRFATPITQNLFGVMIDKAYAQNLQLLIPPFPAQQVIKCQVQVVEQQGRQTIQLPTTPASAAAGMYEDSPPYTSLPSDPDTGNRLLTTNENGIGTFLVGATSYTMFDLNAQWQPPKGALQTLTSPAKLVLATNDLDGSIPRPSIPGVTNGGVLTIPPAPAPTFKVQVPSNQYTNYVGSQIAVLLNDRMVYDGPADPAINGGVDVAYAALNLSGTNNLVYIGRTTTPACAASLPFAFRTTGAVPQNGPNNGNAPRPLAAPTVNVPIGETIGARDIMNGGLRVEFPPYSDVVPGQDVITMYFYLSGKDVLTGKQIVNIVPVIYPVVDRLPTTLALPQQYAAGYASGQLQVDYKVVNPMRGTRWSIVSPTYPLNTTFVTV